MEEQVGTEETTETVPESLIGNTTEETTEETTPETTTETSEAKWHYADGVAGEGDRPDWLKENFKSAQAQAEAYVALESRFGAFTGAPKDGDYKTNVPEEFGAWEIQDGDPALAALSELCKENEVSQEFYDKLVGTYAGVRVAEMTNDRTAEREKLGEDADRLDRELSTWANAKLQPEDQVILSKLCTTAENVRFFDRLRLASFVSDNIPEDVDTVPTTTETLKEATNRLAKIDTETPEGRAEYEKAAVNIQKRFGGA